MDGRKLLIRIVVADSKRGPSLFLSLITDFILLNFSFFMSNYLKRATFRLPSGYFGLLLLFYAAWIIISHSTKSSRASLKKTYLQGLIFYLKSIIFIAYIVCFCVIVLDLASFSRFQIFGTCVILYFLEIAFFSMYYTMAGDKSAGETAQINIAEIRKAPVSTFLISGDFILLSFSFYFVNLLKQGRINLASSYNRIFIVLLGLWLICSIITKKFDAANFQNFYYALAACVKSVILMGASLSIVIFAFRFTDISRLHVFETLSLFFLSEVVLYYIYFVLKLGNDLDQDIESTKEVRSFFEQRDLPIPGTDFMEEPPPVPSFMKILSERLLRSYPDLFKFVSMNLDLTEIKDSETAIMSSSDLIQIEILGDNLLSLLINLHRLNDIRWINRYFLEVHKHLVNSGYLIGRADILEIQKKRIFEKYPKYFAWTFYLIHFIFFRVLPKLSLTKRIYFYLTKGRGRAISRAEILGRLHFCGYKVLAEREMGDSFYFIAQKAKTPSLDRSPSYSPFIKLKRIGLNGQIIHIYKFRTMFPYSEYLQDYVYRHHNLREGGKIKDDFRITEWGRFMRKYWLDEIPMIYNWVKGEIKLFGVRPLSRHYLGLYDDQLQELRNRIKPGLIPPYYADLPKELEEIKESERRYLLAYCKNPFRTQWVYFWRVLNNIIIRGARTN
jgi:hypothetical protein